MCTPWHPQTLRRTAWCMVWVWGMFWAIGIAHACSNLLAAQVPTPATSTPVRHHEVTPPLPTAAQNAICLTVCVSEQAVLTKSSHSDRLVDIPTLFVLQFPVLTVATSDQGQFAPPEPVPWRRELPVTLRFPRLII